VADCARSKATIVRHRETERAIRGFYPRFSGPRADFTFCHRLRMEQPLIAGSVNLMTDSAAPRRPAIAQRLLQGQVRELRQLHSPPDEPQQGHRGKPAERRQ